MLYHKYLEKLFGSKLRINVLRTLYRFKDRAFTLRELSKFSNVTHQGLLKVLDDLNGMNIIKMERVGKSIVVKFNKNSFLTKIIGIYKTESETMNELIIIIKNHFNHRDFKSVALFGSLVRGEERFNSDVDLLILTNNKKLADKCSEKCNLKVIEKFGNVLTPYILSKNEFRKSNIRKTVMEDNIIIKGDKLK